jgi:hypothetical protein
MLLHGLGLCGLLLSSPELQAKPQSKPAQVLLRPPTIAVPP